MKHKIGDVLFVHCTNPLSLVSTAVMLATTNKINPFKNRVPYHCCICLDQYTIIESVWGKGIRKVSINHYDRQLDMITWWKRMDTQFWPDGSLAELHEDRLREWLLERIGQPYDKWQILSIAFRSIFRIIPPLYRFLKNRTSWLDRRFKFICSELVYRAYGENLHIDLFPSANASTISPHDLNRSEYLMDC